MRNIKNSLLLIVYLTAFAPLGSALAAKLGYVDAARLLEEAPQAQAASARLKEEFASREEELTALQAEVKRLEESLDRDAAVMSESESKKLSMDVMSRKRELRRKQDEFREDVNLRRNDAIGGLQDLIKKAIEAVGREGQYDLIFYESIAYANEDLDLTNKVLDGLRKMAESSPPKKN